MSSDYFIIMGARVYRDGRPSGVLVRRIEGALNSARLSDAPHFLPTGGLGGDRPAEAVVAREHLIRAGVSPDRITIDAAAADTLASVQNCVRIVGESGDARSVTICSDPFHLLRCVVLFRVYGVSARSASCPGSREAMGWRRWFFYWVRDLAALAWDLPQAIVDRSRSRA